MTPAEFLTELNIRIDDADNFAFTEAEKTNAIEQAYKDSYSVKTVWDDSLSFSTSVFQYAVPDELDSIKDIYLARTTTQNPDPIESDLWEVIDGNIHFTQEARGRITDGSTLYLKGNVRYAVDETVEEIPLQEYILTLATHKLYKSLSNKKLMRFVKNDTSISEIIAIKRESERDVQMARGRLQRSFEGA